MCNLSCRIHSLRFSNLSHTTDSFIDSYSSHVFLMSIEAWVQSVQYVVWPINGMPFTALWVPYKRRFAALCFFRIDNYLLGISSYFIHHLRITGYLVYP